MEILVTGGLGFIGSHTVVELQNKGFEVVIVDNLSNTRIDVLEHIQKITNKKPHYYNFDIGNIVLLKQLFDKHTIKGVIHFAASKAVGESVSKPLHYYQNNIGGLLNFLKEIQQRNVRNFIFSSSCTVYGEPDILPITEKAPVKPAESPYGTTKQFGEIIIKDICKANEKLKAIALRYFNPIGCHNSYHIGELPLGVPQNLVPFITQTAAGIRKELSVFGGDYPTKDGTAIRDYIHVVDLAKAHIAALERLLKNKHKKNYEYFNLGTGKGTTVLEVIKTFEKITQKTLNYKIVKRRIGDITAAFADTNLANQELNWKAKKNLEAALQDAWEWQKKQK